MITETDYIGRDAHDLASLMANGDVSANELLDAALARMEAVNPLINAVINVFEDKARSQIAEGLGQGPLSGVPFLLKDLRASYKGTRSTAGNAFMSTEANFDSIVTNHYKNAGLVIFGKTNVPEMGLAADTYNTLFGPTKNPWDTERTAGGSSGGAAAAVAAGIVPAAHATDGAGSIRIPASCCGVFGLKPSRGRVSYGPDVGEELIGLSTQHVCSRSVRDSALLLDIASVPDYGDPYWAPQPTLSFLEHAQREPGKLRIALVQRPPIETEVDPECLLAARTVARRCEELGHIVEETDHNVRWADDGYDEALTIILGSGMFANVHAKAKAKGVQVSEKDFLPAIWSFLEVGMRSTAEDFYMASRRMHALTRKMADFHNSFDVILSPTLSQIPLPRASFDYQIKEGYTDNVWNFSAYTPLYNASGQPAMTMPLHWTSEGVPVGVQFAARYGNEGTLLELASQLEREMPWRDRAPNLP
ncbi:amidase [Pararhodobacter oceanensis]|uniref:Amidase n=1 Tax=Pararhodobacter oceanensis TaxID=2172121 RepID=A0A2T8HPB5_9RHOB|nr:amidase [Pararhodobacter oceanensis]PVH27256.1 amidase [Pararhodobacter oceanensis]